MSARASQVKNGSFSARHPLSVIRRKDRRLVKRSGVRRIAPAMVVGSILVAATVFGVLLAQVVLAQSGFKMQKLREEVAKADEEHARLVLKAAKLESPQRIEKVAIEELGMVFPAQNPEYIVANVRTRSSRALTEVADKGLVAPSDSAAALGGSAP